MAKAIVLPETLDHRGAGQLAGELAGLRRSVQLDASGVAHVGGLAAQLILHACRTAPASRKVSLANPSDACLQGFARLGIDAASLS